MSNLATITNNILADSGIDDINVIVSTGSYANPAWITSLAWTKITGAPANIITGTGTAGQVAFFNGTNSISSEINLLWDSSNNRLGIGVTPTQALDVVGKIKATDDLVLAQQNPAISFDNGVSGTLRIFSSFAADTVATFNSTGGFRLNQYGTGARTGTRAYDLAVDSSGNVIEVAVGAGTITGGGTAGQIAIFNGLSSITSESSFTYNSSTNIFSVNGWVDSYRRFRLYFNDIQTLAAELYEDGASTNGGTLTLYGKASGTVATVISAAPTKLNFINNAANVMIGWDTDQFYKLAVNGDFYAALDARVGGSLFVGATSSGGYRVGIFKDDEDILRLHNNTTTGDALIAFTNADAGFLARIQGFDGGGLQFDVGNGAGGLVTNALRIVNTGEATFSSHVNSGGWFAAPNGFGLTARNAAGTAGRVLIKLNTGNQIEIGRDSDISAIRMGTASANDAFTMLSNGNVGINFTNPSQALQVSGRIRVSPDSANGGDLAVNDGGLALSAIGSAPIQFWRNNYSNLSLNITSAGAVVIGGMIPVNEAAGRGNLTINGTTTSIMNLTVNAAIRGYMYHNGTTMDIANIADGDIEFFANNTLIAAIKAATSGQRNFTVGNAVALSTAANRANITINGTSNSILAFGTSNVLRGYLYCDGTSFLMNSGAGDFTIENNTTTALVVKQNGRTQLGFAGTPNYTAYDLFVSRGDSFGGGIDVATGYVRFRGDDDSLYINRGGTDIIQVSNLNNVSVNASPSGFAKFRVFNNTVDTTFGVRIQALFGPLEYQDSDANAVYGGGLSETQFQNGNSSRPAMISLGGNLATAEALGVINFFRSDNSDGYRSRAHIASGVTNTGTAGQHGGTITFATADDGMANPTERARFQPNGRFGVNNNNPSTLFDVNGAAGGITFDTNNNSTFATSILYTIKESGVSRTITTGGYSYGPSNPLTMILTQNSNTPLGMFYAADNADGAGLKGFKSRGTVAAPASVSNADTIFSIEGWAFHGSGPNHAKFGAGMRFVKDDNYGTANTYAPQRTEFYNADTTTTLRTNMIIYPTGLTAMAINGGNVLIGTTTDVGAKLYVDGAFRTGTLTAGTQTAAVDWRLGNARGGTATANALVRVQINGVLVDLIGNYV
jgi:hypothetical protein